jgi:hypothetical protein
VSVSGSTQFENISLTQGHGIGVRPAGMRKADGAQVNQIVEMSSSANIGGLKRF